MGKTAFFGWETLAVFQVGDVEGQGWDPAQSNYLHYNPLTPGRCSSCPQLTSLTSSSPDYSLSLDPNLQMQLCSNSYNYHYCSLTITNLSHFVLFSGARFGDSVQLQAVCRPLDLINWYAAFWGLDWSTISWNFYQFFRPTNPQETRSSEMNVAQGLMFCRLKWLAPPAICEKSHI